MVKNQDFDVIVIGGGPAGSTASYLLRLQGLNVLVIDKDVFPRQKLCGGFLTFKTLKLLQRVYGDTLKTLQDKQIINYISYSYELRTEQLLLKSGDIDFPNVFVDRSVYDNYLLDLAKKTGVSVYEGERVLTVDSNSSTVKTVSGKEFKAKIIIGADGANSVVRRVIPNDTFDTENWRANLATGLEVTIPREDVVDKITSPVIYFGVVPWGYGWVFPNKEDLLVGVGCLSPKNSNIKKSLEKILAFIGYKPKTVCKALGHPIPYGNFLTSPAYNSTLLLGDAAGLVDPLMGEGIYYAQRSAEVAAKCVIEAVQNGHYDSLAYEYTQSLRANIISELSAIRRFRSFFFGMMDLFGLKSLNLIIDIVGVKRFSELVHGARSYQWLKKGGVDEYS